MIIIANADDWVGIYIDGKLVYGNHDIEPERLLELLKIPYESKWAKLKDGDVFPDNLKDVVFE